MKTKALYLLLGLSAGLALSACTDNDTTVAGGVEDTTVSGGKAYMVVKINDVGTTRATGGDFEYGLPNEQDVANAHFYFYDDEHVFVTEAIVNNISGTSSGPSTSSDDESATDDNIEFKSETVITLQGLTRTGYPTYMVTVLNKPDGFTAPNMIEDFDTALANGTAEGGIQDADGYFTMSTSSYVADSDERPRYFVNELTDANFSLEPIETATDVTPVDVYVERLAAKVTLNTNLTNGTTLTGVDGTVYPISHSEEIDGVPTTTNFYVRIDGWALNATARYTYMVKAIDDTWTNTTGSLGEDWTWNDPTNHRSSWGMSYNYGDKSVTYPESSNGNYDNDENGTGDDSALNKYLKYTSLKDDNLIALGSSDYCAENTNTVGSASGVVALNTSSALTSILVKATLLTAEGDASDFVLLDGQLYTEEDYILNALNQLKSSNRLNVWYKVEGDEEKYAQIDENYVEVGSAKDENDRNTDWDGKVRVILNEKGEETTFYYMTETVDSDGKTTDTYTSYEEGGVQTVLDVYNNEYGYDANYYASGAMYYNIPIQHYNDTYEEDGTIEAEASYGVVRNHHYYVTITELANIGRGIYDPDEVIIPQKEVPTYFTSSVINILSWKIVEQSVSL